eukprot:g13026.t1
MRCGMFVSEGVNNGALKKYEKGIRLLGLLNYELDDEGLKAFEQQTQDGRELLSILAANAAQMYLDPSIRQLSKAIQRRATAALDYVDHVVKGTDAILAQAQRDVRNGMGCLPQWYGYRLSGYTAVLTHRHSQQENAAGKALQERLARKRQALLGPIMRDTEKPDPEIEPEWFQQVNQRAIFVCMCGRCPGGACQWQDKKAISVGVAYVGYKAPDELEMFTEELMPMKPWAPSWQKKYYRMLRLGERATRVPKPRQVVVHGEVYSVWSLLEGRVRVMRSAGLLRYCAQLLWHGEPFVFQSCRPYLRFAPMWDQWLRNDLAVALRRSQLKPVISWMSRTHEDEPWQWISQLVDYETCQHNETRGDSSNCTVPPGALAAGDFDKTFGWIRWKRRLFSHSFGIPSPVAFFTPHNAFSTCDILTEVPADPCLKLVCNAHANSLHFHGQLTCENVRLHSHGWDVFTPSFMTLAGKHTISLRHVMTLAAGFLHEPPPCAVSLRVRPPNRKHSSDAPRVHRGPFKAFVHHTSRPFASGNLQDMNYLIMLQRRNPKSYIIPWHMEGGAWDVIWRLADEPGAYYIKIDDDVVFIADGAIPDMIREKRRGRFLFVSANVVNHGILSAVHQEMSSIPHLEKPPMEVGQTLEEQKLGPWQYKGEVMVDPRYRIEHTFYSDCVWRRWDCAALGSDYPLIFDALDRKIRDPRNSSCLFDFGIFDFHAHGYETMSDGLGRSIDWNDNFFAFQHEDFDDIDWVGVATDDERALGSAIIAHWTFSIQEKGLLKNTTLLERYRARAEIIMQDNAERFYFDRRDVILLSGGAKGELRAHRRSSDGSDPLSCIWSTSLGKVDPIIEERDESEEEKVDEVLARLEERVMAVSTMKESEDTVLLAAASSSGYLRSWRLQLKSCLECNDVTVEFLQRQQVSNTTALCMEGFQDPDWGVFVGSADGKLAACKLAGSCGPCLDLQLHDAGVNDLALKTLDSQEVLAVLTAGDDHRMGLCHFTLDGELQLASSRLIEAHFSAVRSVCWAESFPLTLGLDRRLRLWNEDQLKAEWVTCCTEPETMVSVTGTENVTGRTLVVLAGRGVELCSDRGPNAEHFTEQKVRADALLDPWENKLTPMDEEILEMPVPTPVFWTTVRPKEASPWDIGRRVGHRFKKGNKRMLTSFERTCGVDMTRQEVEVKGKNAGFNGDRDFEDSTATMQSRYRQFNDQLSDEAHRAWRSGLD